MNKLNFTSLLWWRSFLFKWRTEVTGHLSSVSVCNQGHAAEHPSALTLLGVFLSSIWVCMYGKDRSLVLSWCWDGARDSSRWDVVQLSSVMGYSLHLAWAGSWDLAHVAAGWSNDYVMEAEQSRTLHFKSQLVHSPTDLMKLKLRSESRHCSVTNQSEPKLVSWTLNSTTWEKIKQTSFSWQ